MEVISGYSKLSKSEKLAWLATQISGSPAEESAFVEEMKSFWHRSEAVQKRFDEFSENTLTNYYMPFGVAPNVLINGDLYAVPMVIEESSVVAAASQSAKFWQTRGGFKTEVLSMEKVGQVHFFWEGNPTKLNILFDELKELLLDHTALITKNMNGRGGGILAIELVDMTAHEPHYYQIKATFDTCDSMGANFINTCLEEFARTLKHWAANHESLEGKEKEPLIIMSILSNYTPQCLVRAWVECPIADLGEVEGFSAEMFAYKIEKAVKIAKIDVHRATTHNKGIMNGIDAVILATGNDFRAVEACAHTYAARNGSYQSLSHCTIDNGMFKFWLDIPLAIGTVGGLTTLHPTVQRAFDILGNPDAKTLMQIVAVIGLAQNFGALKSLTTSGIQKGHMKMHLLNILNHFNASPKEIAVAVEHFKSQLVSFSAVREVLDKMRVNVA